MFRYARLIFADGFFSWVPAIATVTLVTILLGVSANQFAWTHDKVFISAVAAAGHDVTEFTIVSETIYLLVAPLAFLALTVVGSVTVDRVRVTFAQWRLAGASPGQVRGSMWMIVAMTAGIGAFAGSLLAIPASYALIPVFNRMAVSDFAAPGFRPSLGAWLLSVGLSFATCWLGAFAPAIQASRIGPVEVFRTPDSIRPRMSWRVVFATLFLLASLGLAAASAFVTMFSAGVGGLFNLVLNSGMMALVAAYLLGPLLAQWLLRLFARTAKAVVLTTAAVACRAAGERAGTSTNTIPLLAAGIGGAGVLTVSTGMSVQVMRAAGYQGEVNLTDTLVMLAIISVVCLITSAAVVALAGRDIEREQSLLRVAGMTPRTIVGWYAWQAVALSTTAVAIGLVPILVTVATAAVGTSALLGHPMIVLPWPVIAIGFVASSIVLFSVLYFPASKPLSRSVAEGLRE